ncbi:unnamed protein product [Haemonchus placei]|uniref:Uncharacterized protein n=1 Tax=Haemonchus placei TaxID=6290 RepID=A0A0N4X212_HAEPC|nr:unnamed protein product [Haemonchus placei]
MQTSFEMDSNSCLLISLRLTLYEKHSRNGVNPRRILN